MTRRRGARRVLKLTAAGGALLGLTLCVSRLALPQPAALSSGDFVQIAPEGFGDPQNSGTWSMQWWKGKLYVGTVRAFYCWNAAWFNMQSAFLFPYPPTDPDTNCAKDPTDLPLQAEIWRYTPETATWSRLYQAPNDVPIPGHPGKLTARDIGYRTMAVFTDPDGTEALYVGGATMNLLWPPLPPPRILRSADGETFAPVPQDPGTLLGHPPNVGSFRSMEVHNGRLYVVDGKIRGEGVVFEADNPAGGNDNFRQITPDGMAVFQVASFNGFLYIGVADVANGYAVLKADTSGSPPYRFVPVVTHGGFLPFLHPLTPSKSVVSMHVFNGRLYVGMDQPAELIRINPDDSWDLLLGTPRATPTGLKQPLSGLGAGFDWPLNIHVWRMQAHEGTLYLGTLDNSTRWKVSAAANAVIQRQYGFDLYHTGDGFYFAPITTNGFGDKFQLGLRGFASAPPGLFVGSVSLWSGLRVWLGTPVPPSLEPASRLDVEQRPGPGLLKGNVLSWEPPTGATRFRVLRADLTTNGAPQLHDPNVADKIAGPPREVGTAATGAFVDWTARPEGQYHYFVVAENAAGARSGPSNVVRAPSLASPVTFHSLENTLLDWAGRRGTDVVLQLRTAASDLKQGSHFDAALRDLQQVGEMVQDDPTVLPPWRAQDAQVLLAKLTRRVRLARAGVISVNDVL